MEYLSNELSIPFNTLEKFRDPVSHNIFIKDTGIEVEKKDVVLFDDIITSGGTAIEACKIILDKKPKSLKFFVIHSLANKDIFEKIKDLGVKEIISTNTIPRTDIVQLDITQTVCRFIEEKFL